MVRTHNAVILFICMVNEIIGYKYYSTMRSPHVSRRCKGMGICETVINYPTMLARKLIQELKDNGTIIADDPVLDTPQKSRQSTENTGYIDLRMHEVRDEIFDISFDYRLEFEEFPKIKKDITTFRSNFGGDDEEDLSPRISYDSPEDDSFDESNEKQLCESTVQFQAPKIAENRNNTWKFILNDDREPIQTFRAERCERKRSECSKMSFLPNYEGVCVQGWILKEMYYIDENGHIATDYFKVPTCCSCRLFHKNK